MDTVKGYCENILKSSLSVCVWGAIVLILLVMIYMAVTKQGFLNEFRSAPIAAQRSPELLGVGQPLRFTEFSSTNQGGSHVVGESVARSMMAGTEHMTGSPEAPVFNEISAQLEHHLRQTAGGMSTDEAFVGRNMYSEAFGNADAKLKNLLHGN